MDDVREEDFYDILMLEATNLDYRGEDYCEAMLVAKEDHYTKV